jgi:hypothetical protein
MEESMKQLVSFAMVLSVAVTTFACGDSGSSSGNGSSSGGGSGGSSSGGGGAPSITITMPAANASVAVTKPTDTVSVAYTTQNFTGVAPLSASCANTSNNCGHIHVLIDGAACTPDGAPYNNDGFASPVNAILSSCPTVNGMHTVTLELHHNDHSPILDANMMTISGSAPFTATGG